MGVLSVRSVTQGLSEITRRSITVGRWCQRPVVSHDCVWSLLSAWCLSLFPPRLGHGRLTKTFQSGCLKAMSHL
ncbi:hypothetical protein CSUI_010817 [Cystoisospora suis]|uniref:Uncharacterized protein n=1 Tax=Cystoisospora suis TaxID=483139 RepID=A0A2C6KFQ0_9APIC|nr:hypothetical protein CSUI_010817 [Cystoisospora suis]